MSVARLDVQDQCRVAVGLGNISEIKATFYASFFTMFVLELPALFQLPTAPTSQSRQEDKATPYYRKTSNLQEDAYRKHETTPSITKHKARIASDHEQQQYSIHLPQSL